MIQHQDRRNRSLSLQKLIGFLNELEKTNIYYRLNKVRQNAILIEIVVPGQRWEVEFYSDGTIEIEKFISDGDYYDTKELGELFKHYSDFH